MPTGADASYAPGERGSARLEQPARLLAPALGGRDVAAEREGRAAEQRDRAPHAHQVWREVRDLVGAEKFLARLAAHHTRVHAREHHARDRGGKELVVVFAAEACLSKGGGNDGVGSVLGHCDDHLGEGRLQLDGDALALAVVDETQPPVGHHEHVAGVRVRIEEAELEKLEAVHVEQIGHEHLSSASLAPVHASVASARRP
mmetsp:Transcript_24673/g.57061  ORF Transcript_24673/g.57061 Transcript_24673/m.57061 type:complete len:202 (-) Transcript_24673:282-887(-)